MPAGRPATTPSDSRGAYGLRSTDLPASRALLEAAPDSWAEWRLTRRSAGAARETDFVDEWRASVALQPDGRLRLDRERATATIEMRRPPGDDHLVHPYLAPIAAIAGRWLGRNVFHAGGFATEGGAWGVLGDSSAGKSALIAGLALRGLPIVADDLLVVKGTTVLRGPACVDLREDAARALGAGRRIGASAGRERYRVDGPHPPPELPLRGLVALGWHEAAPRVRATPPVERLPRLLASVALAMEPSDPQALLDLAALPLLRLDRPYGFDALDESLDVLLEETARAGRGRR